MARLFSSRRSSYSTGVFQTVLLLLVLGCLADAQKPTFEETNALTLNATSTTPATQSGHEWSYEEENEWTHNFESCKGHHQSPIAINISACFTNLTCGPFAFNEGYSKPPSASTIINTGHTAQITITDKAAFSGGPLPAGSYNFVQLHFHWGGNDSLGSEHTLDGKRYPLELHLVHYHQNYSSFGEALGKKGGVAVLGVWFEISDTDNELLKPLVDAFPNIRNKGETSKVLGQRSLYDFLPGNKNSYFHYDGSLTTPNCLENVLWVLYTSREGISHKQLEAFRGLQEEQPGAKSMHHLENNFRHLQPLYDRTVYLVGSARQRSPTLGVLLLLLLGVNVVRLILY